MNRQNTYPRIIYTLLNLATDTPASPQVRTGGGVHRERLSNNVSRAVEKQDNGKDYGVHARLPLMLPLMLQLPLLLQLQLQLPLLLLLQLLLQLLLPLLLQRISALRRPRRRSSGAQPSETQCTLKSSSSSWVAVPVTTSPRTANDCNVRGSIMCLPPSSRLQ